MNNQTRSILAILSTDIPDYTKKTEEDETYAFSLIAKHRDIINKYVHSSNGSLFKEMGDGTFSKFDSAIDASRCAIKIQNEAINRKLPLRIGLHLGDVFLDGNDVLGAGVNIANRIQNQAKTGEIYISDDIFKQIKNQTDLSTEEAGNHNLKGVDGDMRLHQLIFNIDYSISKQIEVTRKIKVSDEDGNIIQKEAPKDEYLKRVALFYFKNESSDSKLDWLQYGITIGCNYVLQQEQLLDTNQPAFSEHIRKNEYNSPVNIPNLLKRKLALSSNRQYWFSGNLSKKNNDYKIITQLYDVKYGKLVEEREFIGNNIFLLIDNISLQLRYDLNIPSSHIENTENQFATDIFTANKKAFKFFTEGTILGLKNHDIVRTKEHFYLALKHDKHFVAAWLNLISIHTYHETDKLNETLKKGMSLIYKLPEPYKYYLKDSYFRYVEQDHEKCIKLNELWIKLQPENFVAHKQLAKIYVLAEKLDKAIKEYELLLKLDNSNYDIIIEIVTLFKRQKNYSEALNKLKKYVNDFPEDYRVYIQLGNLYDEIGEFDKAKDAYVTGSLIEPTKLIAIATNVLEPKFGNFDIAVKGLNSLIDKKNMSELEDRSLFHNLSVIYEDLARYNESIESLKNAFKDESYYLNSFFIDLEIGRLYLLINDIDSAKKIIEKCIKKNLKPPLLHVSQVLSAELYLLLGNINKAKKSLIDGEKIVSNHGLTVFEHEINRISGMICEKENDFNQAIKYYEKGIHESPP